MKESFWIYFVIILGLFVLAIMILVKDLTSTGEEDYYLTKEVMRAALIESIDKGIYRKTGKIRIIREKFVENFTRRFAESVVPRKYYKLEFFEIYEEPPKATVRISTKTQEITIASEEVDFNVLTILSSIIEANYQQREDDKNNGLECPCIYPKSLIEDGTIFLGIDGVYHSHNPLYNGIVIPATCIADNIADN